VRSGVWERLSRSPLLIDQADTTLNVDRVQVEQFYLPLATTLLASHPSASRFMVAVAGPPGSGKTAFASTLVAVINAEAEHDMAVLVGLDGWHYPNAYLATRFINQGDGQITLQRIKGSPETFDATNAYDCLSKMRNGGRVTFPVYSRRLHEPMSGGGLVALSHKMVIVEGNYLLLDEDPWRRFLELFDVCIFISAPLETLVASLAERHQRGGKSPEVTTRHIRQVDLPNASRVVPSAARAQVLVHKADARTIDRIEWRADS